MTHPGSNRSGNPFLTQPYDELAWMRLPHAMQGGAMQADDPTIEFPAFDTQYPAQVDLGLNEAILHPNYLSVPLQPFNPYPLDQAPGKVTFDDSGCFTRSSIGHTESSIVTGNETFDDHLPQDFSNPGAGHLNHQPGPFLVPSDSFPTGGTIQGGKQLTVLMRGPSKPKSSSSRPTKETKRRKISLDSNVELDVQREPKRLKLSPSHLIGASTEQEDKLQQYLSEWETRERLPAEKELRALATLTAIPFYKVAMWYGDRLRIAPRIAEPLSPASPSGTDLEALQDIAKYVEDGKDRECSTAHSRKGFGGKYKCTWGCGYSTDHRDAWRRHEEKRQPQKFWHCILCHAKRKAGERMEPFIAHRRDKFLPHAKTVHPSEDANELRAKSKIAYNAPFINYCTFILKSTGKMCNHTFVNWKERNEHYIQHFEEAMPDDSSDDFSNDESDDDDEDSDADNDKHRNNQEHPLPTNAFAGSSNSATFPGFVTVPSSYGRERIGQNQRYGDCAMSDYSNEILETLSTNADSVDCDADSLNEEMKPCLSCDRNQLLEAEFAAKWLIHVATYSAVEATPDMRYLALKYSAPQGATLKCLKSSQHLSRPSLPPFDNLPSVFQNILSLVKDMDFEYLWIDVFCGLKEGVRGIDCVYKQANLILAVGHPSECADKIWHFTCDYCHLSMVQSWAKQSVSFHHLQQLGHGAYSIVDKVELRPTNETFARKIVFRNDVRHTRYLQEIEIMQKLRHPHITSFVAAYYDHNAFNILMSPVADCDLRLFLSCPEKFADKRIHMTQWFVSLAGALAYMHAMKCRHKDIKPANILISGSRVLLTDFGTSMQFSTAQSTSAGSAIMTPKYCAPEVSRNGSRGRSADIFSLGCVFVEMVTVALGRTLENLHGWLEMDQESFYHRATYHDRIQDVTLWVESLDSLHPNESQKRVLQIIPSMLDHDSSKRPSAVEVTKALCSQESLAIDPSTTCPCCSRPALALPDDSLKDSSTVMIPCSEGLQTSVRLQQSAMTAFFNIHLWNKFGDINKDMAASFAMTFTFQSEEIKIERYCPILKWIDLVTWIIRIIWNNCETDFKPAGQDLNDVNVPTTNVLSYCIEFDYCDSAEGCDLGSQNWQSKVGPESS